MWAKRLFLIAAFSAGLTSFPGTEAISRAQSIEPGWMIPAQSRNAQNILSVRDVIDIVRSRFGGEPIGSPRLEQGGGRPFYVISWRFPDEVVREVRVDAATGQMR
jgi:uncharacterized membrane protein YkoI